MRERSLCLTASLRVGLLLLIVTLAGCSSDGSGDGSTPYATPQPFSGGGYDPVASSGSGESSSQESSESQSGADAEQCPTIEVPPLTSDEGSKEVREEINRLARDVACRTEKLEEWVTAYRKDQADWVSEQKRLEQLDEQYFQDCIKAAGLTESQWYDLGIDDEGTPCVDQWFQAMPDVIRAEDFPKPGSPLREYHDDWLRAIVAMGDLAEIYPDSVKPSELPSILQTARSAGDCLSQSGWCFNE